MNILVDIGHPAHVHLFKHFYHDMVERGHNLFVTARDVPAITQLLNIYQIPFLNLGKKHDSLGRKGLDQLLLDWEMFRFVRKNKIDIGLHGITVAHVSRITKMASIIPDDDDDAVEPLFAKYAHPCADVVLTPDPIKRKTQHAVYVPTYHELAYLHPNRFQPDEQVLQEIGVVNGEPYFIVRFNAFKAHHDIGNGGLSVDAKRKLIQMLLQRGKVFITAEREIDEEFRPYQLRISPEKIHSLMYYATMLVGDSQTMTSEAALLGTPAVKCNSFAGKLSVPNEMETKYAFLPNESDCMLEKIDELLSKPNLKSEWLKRRQRMLAEKIDYTAFLTWFIENYPHSATECQSFSEQDWERFR